MKCNIWLASAALGALAPLSTAQAPTPRPQFEVASIKPNPGCENSPPSGNGASPGRLQWSCITLERLIHNAYVTFPDGVKINPADTGISGGPGWIRSDRYSIAAKAEGATPLAQMAGPMLQALLEDRFKLKIHRETKEAPVYSLTVAKSGLKLPPTKEGSCIVIDLNHLPQPPAPGQPMPIFCGNTSRRMKGANMTIGGHGVQMPVLALTLSSLLDRPVIDKTGFTGLFELQLEFTPDADSPAPAAEITGPSIFDALQEQLGLKLMPDKGPVESLVIDHAEKPTEN